ncbi:MULTISPECIES: recombinase family protein [unclassified Arthrobacter]|uniref:recombinase family protein n=1 Tax=unclassified Arthrobacter TaxID=235627 RepID=UPI00339164F8
MAGCRLSSGTGRVLFAFFAAMAEAERENIRETTLEGLNTAARKGNHGGRPPVITDDMLHPVMRRRANGESVEDIRPDLIIPTGKRKGRNPSPASIYRALIEYENVRPTPKPLTKPTPTLPRSSRAPDATERSGFPGQPYPHDF